MKGALAITGESKPGENSFYGSLIEPLAGFESNQATNENVKVSDGNENQSMLPTINQNRNLDALPKVGSRFTKPSTLGNLSGYSKGKK